MARWPARLLHASDLHLEWPLEGLAEYPDALRDVLADCAYLAAGRVFQAALDQQVDFVVLAGDLCAPHETGLRGPLFIAEQCGRLAERGIPVYWVPGEVDDVGAWPEAVTLPENVTRLGAGGNETTYFHRDGAAQWRIVGRSQRSEAWGRPDWGMDPEGLGTIAVVYDPQCVEGHFAGRTAIDYWALGGSHRRFTWNTASGMAHDPGLTQGRRPEHVEAHGATLVDIDAATGRVRTSLVQTESVRWHTERLTLLEHTTRDQLEQEMRQRIGAWRQGTNELPTLVTWMLAGSGPLARRLRSGEVAADLLERLRRDYGAKAPVVWSVGIEVESPWDWSSPRLAEDTILGDYLRQLKPLETGDADLGAVWEAALPGGAHGPAGVEGLVGAQGVAGEWLRWDDAASRHRAVRRAAWLGVDLLANEEGRS